MAQSRSEADDIVAIKCIDKKALQGKEDSLENEIRVLRRLVLVCPARRKKSGRPERVSGDKRRGAMFWLASWPL